MMQIDLRRTAAVLVGVAMVAGIAYLLVSDSGARPTAPLPPAANNEGPTPTPSPTPTIEPPPELANRGNDFDAIWRSINDYRNWLYAHDPRPVHLRRLYEQSCSCYEPEAKQLRRLWRNGWRYEDGGERVLSVQVAERKAGLVVLEVVSEYGEQLLIDTQGEIVDREFGWKPTRWSIGLHRGSDGRWRVDHGVELGPAR